MEQPKDTSTQPLPNEYVKFNIISDFSLLTPQIQNKLKLHLRQVADGSFIIGNLEGLPNLEIEVHATKEEKRNCGDILRSFFGCNGSKNTKLGVTSNTTVIKPVPGKQSSDVSLQATNESSANQSAGPCKLSEPEKQIAPIQLQHSPTPSIGVNNTMEGSILMDRSSTAATQLASAVAASVWAPVDPSDTLASANISILESFDFFAPLNNMRHREAASSRPLKVLPTTSHSLHSQNNTGGTLNNHRSTHSIGGGAKKGLEVLSIGGSTPNNLIPQNGQENNLRPAQAGDSSLKTGSNGGHFRMYSSAKASMLRVGRTEQETTEESNSFPVGSAVSHPTALSKRRREDKNGLIDRIEDRKGRVIESYADGRQVVIHPKGTKRVNWPNGFSTIHFVSGDVKEIFPPYDYRQTVGGEWVNNWVYYFAAFGTVVVERRNGLILVRYDSGILEFRDSRRFMRVAIFPDGVVRQTQLPQAAVDNPIFASIILDPALCATGVRAIAAANANRVANTNAAQRIDDMYTNTQNPSHFLMSSILGTPATVEPQMCPPPVFGGSLPPIDFNWGDDARSCGVSVMGNTMDSVTANQLSSQLLRHMNTNSNSGNVLNHSPHGNSKISHDSVALNIGGQFNFDPAPISQMIGSHEDDRGVLSYQSSNMFPPYSMVQQQILQHQILQNQQLLQQNQLFQQQHLIPQGLTPQMQAVLFNYQPSLPSVLHKRSYSDLSASHSTPFHHQQKLAIAFQQQQQQPNFFGKVDAGRSLRMGGDPRV